MVWCFGVGGVGVRAKLAERKVGPASGAGRFGVVSGFLFAKGMRSDHRRADALVTVKKRVLLICFGTKCFLVV